MVAFKSKQEAVEAVASGDYDPVEGQVNAVLVLSEGIMIYSFDLADFVHISEFSAAGNQANRYIDLDGVNDYIEFWQTLETFWTSQRTGLIGVTNWCNW